MRSSQIRDVDPRNVSLADLEGLVSVAETQGGRYLTWRACRKDYWWRSIHTTEDPEVLKALTETYLALALPKSLFHLEDRKCRCLPTILTSERKLECDSRISFSARENDSQAAAAITGSKKAKGITKDIDNRGSVIFAEMQQKLNFVKKDGEKVDDISGRLRGYAGGVEYMDNGNPGARASDIRRDKAAGDVLSRPIIGVAFKCYGAWGDIESNIEGGSIGTSASGRAFAEVSLGDIKTFDRGVLMQQAKKQVNEYVPERLVMEVGKQVGVGEGQFESFEAYEKAVMEQFESFEAYKEVVIRQFEDVKAYEERLVIKAYEKLVLGKIKSLRGNVFTHLSRIGDEEVKQLVSEMLAVFSMSHLFTKNIVGGFLPVVKKICEILEVNMENAKILKWDNEEIRAMIGEFYDSQELEELRKEKGRGLTRNLDSECKVKVDEIGRAVAVGGQIESLEMLGVFVTDRQQQLAVLKELRKRKIHVNSSQIQNDMASEYANTIRQFIEEHQAITEKEFLKIVPAGEELRQMVYAQLCGMFTYMALEPIKQAVEISGKADVIEEKAKYMQAADTLQPNSFCEDFASIDPDLHNSVLEELRTRPGLDRICKKAIEDSIGILKAVNTLTTHYKVVRVGKGKSASQQLQRVKAPKIYDLDDLHLDLSLCSYVLSRLKDDIHNKFPSYDYDFEQEGREVDVVANVAFRIIQEQDPTDRGRLFAAVDHGLQEEVRTLLRNKYKISL
jgi:hypothetical protein